MYVHHLLLKKSLEDREQEASVLGKPFICNSVLGGIGYSEKCAQSYHVYQRKGRV